MLNAELVRALRAVHRRRRRLLVQKANTRRNSGGENLTLMLDNQKRSKIPNPTASMVPPPGEYE